MTTNRNGYTQIDALVAAEVRVEIARSAKQTISGIAQALGVRRATLSVRVNGHVAFEPSLLSAVAGQLGLTAAEIVARAESQARELAA